MTEAKTEQDLAQGEPDFRRELGQQLRVDSVRMADMAQSGHPTSSMSAADLLAVLIDGHLRLDYDNLDNPANDHLIFSKGHASPLYYAVMRAVGAIDEPQLATYRQLGSLLEGHPTPRLRPTDVATGSLGQGLPIGVGLALAARVEQLPYRTWVLCGDSEMAEGSMWEAFQYAGWAGLDSLVAIIDINRLGQANETMLGWDIDGYRRRVEAFGWHAVEVDGHDVEAIEAALVEAESADGRPTAMLARTIKGKGVKAVENQPGKHGKPLEDAAAAIAELGGVRHLQVATTPPPGDVSPRTFEATAAKPPTYKVGDQVATRDAFGAAIAALGGSRGDVVVLDGEVSNSTGAADFKDAQPERFFEMYIAEQQLVAAAVGMQVRGLVPFASTFAAFLSRAFDFIRMAAISRANLRLVGSHAGVSIGEDGPSQMALEDMASIRAIHGSTVLHPSDATQTAKLVVEMADLSGVSFLRTLRGKTTVRTADDEPVRVGGSRIVTGADAGDIAVVACGVTVDEAVKAAEVLESEDIAVRVIDCYSVKPIDAATLQSAARECRGIVTVEDHWAEGGLGDAVLEALAAGDAPVRVTKLAVREMPTSGKPAELLHVAEIDAEAIAAAVRNLVKK